MATESIETIRSLMVRALERRGIHGQDALVVAEDYLSATIEGNRACGVESFILTDLVIRDRSTPPKIIRSGESYALVDADNELGQLAAKFCVDLLCRMARIRGVFIIGLVNSTRCGSLDQYGTMIAKKGLVGLMVDGPRSSEGAVAGKPTNRICFAFPNDRTPLVLHFSAENIYEVAWDDESERAECPRPDGSLVPRQRELGALCLAFDIISGALVTRGGDQLAKTLDDQSSLFVGINPAIFAPVADFEKRVRSLLDPAHSLSARFASVRPTEPNRPVGSTEAIEVDEEVLKRLHSMS